MANALPGHLRDLDQRPINLKDQPAPPHSGTIHLVEDIEDRAALLAITTVALAVFAPLSALAIFAPFTETFGPALGAGSGGGRNGAGRRCCRLSACGHQMFEFSSVKPHAAAGGTHVELDPRARHGLHGTVVIGAEKKRHGPVPSKEERRDAAAGETASGLNVLRPTSPRRPWDRRSQRGPVRIADMVSERAWRKNMASVRRWSKAKELWRVPSPPLDLRPIGGAVDGNR